MIRHYLWAIAQCCVLFLICIPMTLAGVVVVPVALLRPDDSKREVTIITDGINTWWLRRLADWARWWDNPIDGFFGDPAFRWAGRDIPFGWKSTDFLAQFWWGAIRNPLNYFKRFVISCDVRRCQFELLAGQEFVRDRADATGFQFLLATREDGRRYYRIYWVRKWPGTSRAAIVELGHEFRREHFTENYTGREFKAFKGFAFLIHPCKPI